MLIDELDAVCAKCAARDWVTKCDWRPCLHSTLSGKAARAQGEATIGPRDPKSISAAAANWRAQAAVSRRGRDHQLGGRGGSALIVAFADLDSWGLTFRLPTDGGHTARAVAEGRHLLSSESAAESRHLTPRARACPAKIRVDDLDIRFFGKGKFHCSKAPQCARRSLDKLTIRLARHFRPGESNLWCCRRS
jgi:hypothetical protein